MLLQEEKPAVQAQEKPLLHFVCPQARLNHGLSTVSRAVSRRSIDLQKMPLLGYIRMEAKDGFLLFSATDLNISITSKIELTEKKEEVIEGVIAVPAKLFTDLVKEMPDGSVTITVGADYMLLIEHKRGSADLLCMSAEEFFPIPGPDDSELPVLIQIPALKETAREVSISSAVDESIPALACVFVQVKNDKLVFAATDRFRTSCRTMHLTAGSGVTYDLLIPSTSLGELSAILPGEGMVMMSITPNKGQVIFHTQWVTLSSRLVEGKFPDYSRTIPKQENRQTSVTVSTAEFKEIVRLTSIYANAGGSSVACLSVKGSMGMEPGKLQVVSERSEMGAGNNFITAAVEGEDQEQLNFNVKYITDALSVISTPTMILEIGLLSMKYADRTITAPVAVLKPTGSNTVIHSFASLSTGD